MPIIFIYRDLKLNILINVQDYTILFRGRNIWHGGKNRTHPAGTVNKKFKREKAKNVGIV